MAQHIGILSVLCVCVYGVVFAAGSSRYPIILVPGDGGSQLWHKYDSDKSLSNVWLYPYMLVVHLDTVLKQLTLRFDNSTGKTDDGANQTIRACGFGNPDVLTSLVTSWNPFPCHHPHLSEDQCDGTLSATFSQDEFDFQTFKKVMMTMLTDRNLSKNIEGDHLIDVLKRRLSRLSTPIKDSKLDSTRGLRPDEEEGRGEGGEEEEQRRSQQEEKEEEEALRSIFDDLRVVWEDLAYYRYTVKTLTRQHGYIANKDLRGAPYDFRKAPNELDGFYQNLTKLIEETWSMNNNTPVVVVAHSLANPLLLYFYNVVTTQSWRDRYIRAHVALSPPWAGAVKSVGIVTSGDNLKLPIVSPSRCRSAQRSWPSSIWLMPCVWCRVWDPRQPVVVTATNNYTVSVQGFSQLFTDLGFDQGYIMWRWLDRYAPDLSRLPDIRALHVLYGTDVLTPEQLVFPAGAFPDGQHATSYTKAGDGTVNLRSLEALKRLPVPENMTVTHTAFPGVDHIGILNDRRVIDFIVSIASKTSKNNEL